MSNTRSDLPSYPNTQLYIDGEWRAGSRDTAVINPASEAEIGRLALAGIDELSLAADAAARGFKEWRKVSPYERSKLMRRAAQNIRDRAEQIAAIMSMEQGKPLGEARIETLSAADIIEWFAEEGRRTYGRVIPSRSDAVRQIVTRRPSVP